MEKVGVVSGGAIKLEEGHRGVNIQGVRTSPQLDGYYNVTIIESFLTLKSLVCNIWWQYLMLGKAEHAAHK